MRIAKILALAGVSILLGGCATLGPKFTPDTAAQPDRGTVYVYRTGSMGAAVHPQVTANGVPLAQLPPQGYFVYHAAPGELELAQKTEATTSVTLDVKAGETYYVKGSIGIGFFVGHPHLVIVSNDVGAKEIVECKLIPGAIPTAEDVARGPPPAPAKK
jgi:Protein of unknown function (DUF2846)